MLRWWKEEATDGELDGLRDFNTCVRPELEIFQHCISEKFVNIAVVFLLFPADTGVLICA